MNRIYLDYNATTPLEMEVLDAITEALRDAWGNPSSSHDAGVQARKVIEQARQDVALMMGAKPADIIFTSGGTEGNNWILQMGLEHHRRQRASHKKGNGHAPALPHFITSNIEHDSVKLVLLHFQLTGLAEVSFVPVSKVTGRVEVEDVVAAVRPNTVMVSIMAANNETGVIQPVGDIFKKIRAMKRLPGEVTPILLHTDAAQVVGKVAVEVDSLHADYLTVVGHKFYGPRIGAIYVRDLGGQTPLIPVLYGGGQERGYRSGTENTGMIAGLGKACALVTRNVTKDEQHLRSVRDYLEARLEETFGDRVFFNGKFPGSERLPNTCNVSFLGPNLQGHRILAAAERIQASVGAACHRENRPSHILLAMGVPEDVARAAVRLSVGRHTSMADVDVAVEDLRQAVASLQQPASA